MGRRSSLTLRLVKQLSNFPQLLPYRQKVHHAELHLDSDVVENHCPDFFRVEGSLGAAAETTYLERRLSKGGVGFLEILANESLGEISGDIHACNFLSLETFRLLERYHDVVEYPLNNLQHHPPLRFLSQNLPFLQPDFKL